MFDIGWQELFLVAVLALIVIGPKDLPKAIRALRAAIRKLREMAREFQDGVDEMLREADLDDVRDHINRASQLDPKKSITETIDPTGSLTKDLAEFDEVRDDLTDAAQDFKRQTDPDAPAKTHEDAVTTHKDDATTHEDAGEEAHAEVTEEAHPEIADEGEHDKDNKAPAPTKAPAASDNRREG